MLHGQFLTLPLPGAAFLSQSPGYGFSRHQVQLKQWRSGHGATATAGFLSTFGCVSAVAKGISNTVLEGRGTKRAFYADSREGFHRGILA